MTSFDAFAVIDWSAGNDTGPTPRKDAIWLGLVRNGIEQPPEYLRNRDVAMARVADLIRQERASGRRLLIGFDFPFGYPMGFAGAIVGVGSPLRLWDFFAEHLSDRPGGNDRFALAGSLNARFPGVGPFWFNGTKEDIPHLPRKGTDRTRDHGQREKRRVERLAKGSFSCWQMGGAGAVGGQVMTGMAALSRLRAAFPGEIGVWPFDLTRQPVALVEVWPGLIEPAVKAAGDPIRDRAQVRLLARALSRLAPERLMRMMSVDEPEEGWILGVGHEEELIAATRETLVPPPLSDDCFALPRGTRWTPVDRALDHLRTSLHPVTGIETVAAADAAGRVLAADAVARLSHPPAANSAVDGYGFAQASLAPGATAQTLPLHPGRAAAGAPFGGAVPAGHALRILTGAVIPDGVDTVILEEDVTTDGAAIAFNGPLKRGANTRRAGEDLRAGEAALTAGRVLTAADTGVLAAAGIEDISVRRRLRVAVLSTGDEVCDRPDRPGRIADANRPILQALLGRWGYEAVDLGIAPDRPDEIAARLTAGAARADVILTSGGASAGDEDHVSRLLKDSGSFALWRIAIKPGRPLALGLWDGVPVFGLPGNPVAAFVCSLVFARPALSLLAGAGWTEPQGFEVPAAFSKAKKPGRREYLRARVRDGRAEVFASEGSGRVSGLSWAEGLVELPDGAADIAPGTPVRFLPYGSFGL